MELPEITLPKIELPFDIPVLLHPAVDHYAIALPIVILLLELINLVARKRTISILSLFFIILTILAAAAAYFTGSVDAKESFDALSEIGQAELKEHKTLGTYLMIASGLLLILKLLSMMIGRAWAQTLYLLLLIVFVAGILKQGKEGGELVYEHGANVEKVKILDDKIFDLEEALEEATPDIEVPTETNQTEIVPLEVAPPAIEVPTPASEPRALPIGSTTVEPVKAEQKEEVLPVVNEKAETLKVEGMPEEMVQPEIATH